MRDKKIEEYFFIIWGFLMHLIILWGVLDANFHSPIIRGLPAVPASERGPAKRVFLFVADGLRFETFWNNLPPYLSKKVRREGVWGISRARMPTETRPGNIAIVAGLHEDPSALFKGWQENPVEFDSVFNQSHTTWAWGSPDIISLFSKNYNKNFIGKSYPSDWQVFDTSASFIRLDSWVFDHFSQWIMDEAHSVKDKDKIIVFFHLLGCDTAGHAAKPRSQDYKESMKYVDYRIEEVVDKTEKFFQPGSTAYIFTADHGMTDWGSHGSGSTDEIETPFVAWGAGFTNNFQQNNIEQVDITPLIATLLGIPIPVNNEGVLHLELFSSEHKNYGAHALLRNIKQLSLQVKANRELSLGSSEISTHWRDEELTRIINKIEMLLHRGKVSEAIAKGEKALSLAKESLHYFRQYQRNRFIFYLTLMWFGWIALLFLKIAGKPRQDDYLFKLYLNKIIFFAFFLTLLIEYKISGYRDSRLLIYGTLALLSMWLAVRQVIMISFPLRLRSTTSPRIGIILILMLVLIMFAGLIHRMLFTLAMLLTALLQKILLKHSHPRLIWTGCLLAVFPSLPVVQPQPRVSIVLISLCLTIIFSLTRRASKNLKILEIARLILTSLVCLEYLEGRFLISWLILISTLFCIWIYPFDSRQRFIGIVIHLLCPLSLLSASYEPIFFLTLAVHLLCWPAKEEDEKLQKFKEISIEELAKAASLMLYTLLCFFGTGNMASISSFDPVWTKHFVIIFSPFTMMSLILLKIMISMILVGSASRIFTSPRIFLEVLFLGDCLTLPLIFGVTNQGSWLEIGSTVSRFIIAITLPSLLLLLYYISHPLMTMSIPRDLKNTMKRVASKV